MDKAGIRRLPERCGEQEMMERAGCKVVSGAPTIRMGYGKSEVKKYTRIFNVRTHLGACRTHEGWVRHKQDCTGVDSEGQKNCFSPCLTKGSNPGSSDLNQESLTTELPAAPPPLPPPSPPPTTAQSQNRYHFISGALKINCLNSLKLVTSPLESIRIRRL